MKVFLVLAHPESRSLCSSLAEAAVAILEGAGHTVKVSDLYAMKFKTDVDASDFPANNTQKPLNIIKASKDAYLNGTQPADIVAEQEKMLWADTLILIFPLWWYGMPAKAKGWVDRVFACGFGYGRGEVNSMSYFDRFGDGICKGKRAMVLVTIGGYDTHYCPTGVNGFIDDLLFPINHGILFYIGYKVLPPFVVYRATRVDETRFDQIVHELKACLLALPTMTPIPYRQQNGGDYDIPDLVLKSSIDLKGRSGLEVHRSVI